MMKSIAWFAMTFLALAVAGYASVIILFPGLRPPFAQAIFAAAPALAFGHLGGGALALSIGAFQVNSRLRTRFVNIHRWLGRVYVLAVVIGSIAAFMLALRSSGGLAAHFGFGLLAICWFGSTLNAFRHIRSGNITAHRAWMIRSYALTLAAVTLRLYLPASLIAGIPFQAAYPTISWLCWVPNLLVVEWFVLSRPFRVVMLPDKALQAPVNPLARAAGG